MQSTLNRSLDQQCTVTRPAVSAMAAALLVEIMVSVLQHPDSIRAPASEPGSSRTDHHPLGLVPHQIRGFLAEFRNLMVCGHAYESCSACSMPVTKAYCEEGWDFIKRALTDRDYLESLTGLTKVNSHPFPCRWVTDCVPKVQEDADKVDLDFESDEE